MSKKLPKQKASNKKSLPIAKKTEEKQVRLSFECLSFEHEFTLKDTKLTWYKALLEAMKGWTELSVKELKKNSTYELHGWKNKPKYQITNIQQEQLQIRLTKSNGRVHGFMIDNVFYIVWLDPHHAMTDSDNYSSKAYGPPLKTDYEELLERYKKLEKEHNELKEDYKALENLIEESA